jgi:DNA polymerase-3 subunit delta'
MLEVLKGQPRAKAAFEGALERKQISHAWLLEGPEGVGKELGARLFAQALTCKEKPFVGCGECSSCKRVERRNHPDVTWVLPEDEQVQRGWAGRSDFDHIPSRDIRVEQVRALQERLSFRALEAPHKVAILTPAHAMNPQAQNALLKTLEEPPRDTVLLLISSAPDKLLPTIRSRCTRTPFAPLPDPVIIELLALLKPKLSKEEAQQAALMSGGSLTRAVAQDPKSSAIRREVIERFEALERKDARGWLAFAELFGAARADAELVLEVLTVWQRDVAATQAGVTSLVNRDLSELAAKAAQKVSPESLHRRSVLIEEARNSITQRNGAVRLQLERMLVEMMAVP